MNTFRLTGERQVDQKEDGKTNAHKDSLFLSGLEVIAVDGVSISGRSEE